MEKEQNLKEIVQQLLIRGQEKLESAQILLENDKIDDSISRSYYGAYLAARAALLLVGEEPKTHSGTLTLFGLRLIKPGLISQDLGRAFTELFEARQTSDYSVITYYTSKDGKQMLQFAKTILDAVQQLVDKKIA